MQNNDRPIVRKRPRNRKNKRMNPIHKLSNIRNNQQPPPAQQQPEPVELSDDNAPKNPMANNQHYPGLNVIGPNQQNQPKLNLCGPNQAGDKNQGPASSGFNQAGPNQSGPNTPVHNPSGTNHPGPRAQNLNLPGSNTSSPWAQNPNLPGFNISGPRAQKRNLPASNTSSPWAQNPNLPGFNIPGPRAQKPNLPASNTSSPWAQNPNLPGFNISSPWAQNPHLSGSNIPGPSAQTPNLPGSSPGSQDILGQNTNKPGTGKNKSSEKLKAYKILQKQDALSSSLIAKERVMETMKLKGLIGEDEAAINAVSEISEQSGEQNVETPTEIKEESNEVVAQSESVAKPETMPPTRNPEGCVQNTSKVQPVPITTNQSGAKASKNAPWMPSKSNANVFVRVQQSQHFPRPQNNLTDKTKNQQPMVRNLTPVANINKKPKITQQAPVQTNPITPTIHYSIPKGIPRSFLNQRHMQTLSVTPTGPQPSVPVSTTTIWQNIQTQQQFYQHQQPTMAQNSMSMMTQNNMPMMAQNNMPIMAPNNMPMMAQNNVAMMTQNNVSMMTQNNNMPMMMQNNLLISAQNNLPIMSQSNMPMMTQTNMPIMTQNNTTVMAPNNIPIMTQNNMQMIEQSNMSQTNTSTLAPIHLQMYDEIPKLQVSSQSTNEKQAYSPTEMFDESSNNESQEMHEGSESPDIFHGGQKRLSAFKRLGPLAQPKKPKLTINILFNKEEAVREVVDETKGESYVPVHLRKDIQSSTDPIVKLCLPFWPWKENVHVKKSVTVRTSKSVMILEREQMQDEVYDKGYNVFVQVTINDYPLSWTKEQVLDLILDSVKGKSFIPCFIEFNQTECKFLVIKCRSALLTIHKYGFIIREEGVEMRVTISQVDLSSDDVGLKPWSALRTKLAQAYDGDAKLNLSAFTAGNDISHFIYFPLHRVTNQTELVQMESNVVWDFITELDLSHNRLTTVQGFDLPSTMPKLKHLNLSHNCIEKVSMLQKCRELTLKSIWLEGNPLCHDYTDPAEYVKVLRMLFPTITEIDGKRVHRKGEMPSFIRNYCPEDALCVVEKFLEVFFPLLEADEDQKPLIQYIYDKDAVLTITYRYKLRISLTYRHFTSLFLKSRVLEEGLLDDIKGSNAISKLIQKWPNFKHDPYTFTVDVLHHTESSTIFTISGVARLTSDTLAEDEYLIAFKRTIVLQTNDGARYKIKHEMLLWDEPSREIAKKAFQVTAIKTKPLSLTLETAPDEDLKEKLLNIFMNLTEMKRKPSERCLEIKEWNLKNALEYFSRLLKLDSIDSLMCDTL